MWTKSKPAKTSSSDSLEKPEVTALHTSILPRKIESKFFIGRRKRFHSSSDQATDPAQELLQMRKEEHRIKMERDALMGGSIVASEI
jgi:hypothetical protein